MPPATATKKAAKAEAPPTKFTVITLADRSTSSLRSGSTLRRTIRKLDASSYAFPIHLGQAYLVNEVERAALASDIAAGVVNELEVSPEVAAALARDMADEVMRDRVQALNNAVMELADQVIHLGAQPKFSIGHAGELRTHEVEGDPEPE